MIIYRDVEKKKSEILDEIESGAVFIYPTDTVYGIGCNALDSNAVKQIRRIKQRQKNPFSVIAPSKEWIRNNLVVEKKYVKYLEKLPGKYTLIFRMRNKSCVAKEVSRETLGVRIPNHWISKFAEELGFPIVTTSANISGKKPLAKIDKISGKMSKMADFAIDEGELKGKPSEVIDLSGKKPKKLR